MSSKEEAIAAGALHTTKHSMKRRSIYHNYYATGTYMITRVTQGRQQLFGHLSGNPLLPLFTEGSAKVVLSELGNAILMEEIPKINRYYPMVEVWKVCVMPDHLHIILNVKYNLPAGKNLGSVIRGFKQGCTKAYWRCFNITGPLSLFEDNYCDKDLKKPGQIERWKHYLDDNPRRLMLKQSNPELFTQRRFITIGGHKCVCTGNFLLLDKPDKESVIVHRADSEEEYRRKVEAWMDCGASQGVLVGAFISERERAVKVEALENGFPIIQLTNEGIGPYYKPRGKDFDACVAGMMLIISPWPDAPEKSRITRLECLRLNELGDKIAAGRFEMD